MFMCSTLVLVKTCSKCNHNSFLDLISGTLKIILLLEYHRNMKMMMMSTDDDDYTTIRVRIGKPYNKAFRNKSSVLSLLL